MTDKRQSRWDPYAEQMRLARALSFQAEPTAFIASPDKANLGFAASPEILRYPNYQQPASGKAVVTLTGFVNNQNRSQLLWTCGPATPGGVANLKLGGFAFVEQLAAAADPTTVTLVTVTGTLTGGSFPITVGGQTATITYDQLTAAGIQTALAALSTVGAGNVRVTAVTANNYWISLGGPAYGQTVTAGTSTLIGGSATLAAGQSQFTYQGSPSATFLLSMNAWSLAIANATGGTVRVFVGSQFVDVAYNVTAAALGTALAGLSNVGNVNNVVITGTGTAADPFYISFMPQCPAGATPTNPTTPLISASAASLTGSSPTATVAYVGGQPGKLWDVVWKLSGPDSRMEFSAAGGRVATMRIDALPSRYPGVPNAA